MMAKTLPRDTAGAGSVPVLPPLTENGARPPGFVAVDYEVFIDSSLSPAAKLLFARLKLYAGTNGLAYPKHRTLAREMCMSDRQVRTLLNELRALNRTNRKRTRTSCIFEIKPPLEWKKTSALNLRGEQVPDPGADSRAEESFLSDRKFSSALDRKKTSDRREVLKRGSKTKNRQADSSNGIEKPDSVGVDVGVRSQEERQKPWIRVMDPGDRQQVIARMSLFMGNEKPPKRFLAWFDGFVSEHKLSPEQVVDALDKAWNRHAAPGQRNNPRSWNWFYETLRNSFIQGYSARLPEQPARDWCMSPGTVAEMAAGFDPLGDEGIAWDRRGKETPCNAT